MFSGLLATTLAVAMVAGACGGGDDSGGGGGDPTEGGTPQFGGTINYGLEAENDQGWCLPEVALPAAGIQMARAIYDTLTAPNEQGDFVPFLAESVTPDAEYDSWQITLREGITFHDGSELTAEVVKNNLDAYRGQYPARTSLLFTFVFANIDTITVDGPLSLTVTTKTPWIAFPSFLYYSGRIGIMAQAQLDDTETCDRALIGTGPFVLEEWRQNESFTAIRNENYWQSDADGNQLPYLDSIVFRPIFDGPARVSSLFSGELQAIQTSGGEQIVDLREATEAGEINSYESDEFAEISYGMLNVSKEPFNNRDARLAIAYGLNTELINETRNLGVLTMGNGPFSPGNMGYLEDTGYPEFNVEKAKEHVAAYKAATGKDLEFAFVHADDESTTQTAQLLQQMAMDYGVEVELVPQRQGALIDTAIAGDYQAMNFRLYPGGDPDDNYIFWNSTSPVNFGRIKDENLDALMNAGRISTDQAERTKIYEDVNRLFGAEAYNIWLNWTTWDIGTASNVFGILGPDLPDGGGKPFPGLAGGQPLTGMWIQQ